MTIWQSHAYNYDPPGYREMMDEIDSLQEQDSLEEEHNEKVLEALQDDEIPHESDNAMGELFNRYPKEMRLIMNGLAKALVLGGFDASRSVESLLSFLPQEAADIVKNYLFKNVKFETIYY